MPMARRKLKKSEFEGSGVRPTGIIGLSTAWEKLRYAMRTGIVPEQGAPLDAKPGDYGTGGLREPTDKIV